ncbi:UTP--glucose-1-phosphate uridylyltransferase [bacterium]
MDTLKTKLEKYNQAHVLKYWEQFNNTARQRLMDQLQNIDFNLLQHLAELLQDTHESKPLEMFPAQIISLPKTPDEKKAAEQARQLGENTIRSGKVCAFLVAGGQGTRLGYDGPKGCFPIGPVSNKSIFQMHAEKILAAGQRYNAIIPWYIMTSESNHQATQTFFEENTYFGLNAKDVMFFKQNMLPALDTHGKLILDAKDHIFTSPNGHGGSLQALVESGAIEDMKQRGIEVISYFQVDNVLIQIVDPVFIGFHVQAGAEMSSKMLRKRDPYEKLGHFGLVDGKLRIIEYSDMSDQDLLARNADGRLKYEAGSPAIHMIHPEFVLKEMEGGLKLPYHIANKKIPFINEAGEVVIPENPNGYKFETFIFDALQDTTCSIILEARREHEFSPVKNKTGEDSPETAKQELSYYFAEWLEAAGVEIPKNESGDVRGMVEIGPLFADSKEELANQISSDIYFDGSFYLDKE